MFLKVNQEIEKISSQLILKEAFYAHFFSGMLKVVSEHLPTMAVEAKQNSVLLHVNPTFWSEGLKEQDFQYGAIKHEILHILLLHIFRYKEFSHHGIFNVAADLVVNQFIERSQLLEGVVLLELFPELKLKPHESLNYYYEKLYKLYKRKIQEEKEKQSQCEIGVSEGDNEKTKKNKNEDYKISWKNLKSFLQEDSISQQQHALWKYLEGLSSAEKELLQEAIKQKIYEIIKRTRSKEFGKLPAGLQTYLSEFEKSMLPSVNWRRVLRLFANSSAKTFIKNTLKRPSKRYGTTPGIKIKHRNKLFVVIDTSGSVAEDDLKEFFQEIYHIWKQGAEVLVAECDTIIHQTYYYKGQMPKVVKGGGGTDFNAPITYANTKYKPDAIIYFTDGYCDAPKVKSRFPIMWLLSTAGAKEEELKNFEGRILKMS
jgi:predicted metal-dependent peptidase